MGTYHRCEPCILHHWRRSHIRVVVHDDAGTCLCVKLKVPTEPYHQKGLMEGESCATSLMI